MASVDRKAAGEAFMLHRHWRAGFLPGGGGIYDQREVDLEKIETVAAAIAEIEAEKAEGGAHGGK